MNNQFMAGQVAMISRGHWILENAKKANLDMDIADVPLFCDWFALSPEFTRWLRISSCYFRLGVWGKGCCVRARFLAQEFDRAHEDRLFRRHASGCSSRKPVRRLSEGPLA
jgi:hypothetical protein